MLKSKTDLIKLAKELDFKPEMLEKVYRLLTALKQIMSVPYLKERLVLKGGTALNLFCFDKVPRLSVDIDLNYVGKIDRAMMLKERPILNEAITKIFQQNQFELRRNPEHHAGGKMVWHYSSILGQGGNIEIDLNYMYRQPLWPCAERQPKIDFGESFTVPILDIHELAAGKLSALFTRQACRDLFDTYYLFKNLKFDMVKLRLAFVIYMSMTNIRSLNFCNKELEYNLFDIRSKLLPVLRQQNLPRKKDELKLWADDLLAEIKSGLVKILPLKNNEFEFIERIREHGEIKPDLITVDENMQEVISVHPAIKWIAAKLYPR